MAEEDQTCSPGCDSDVTRQSIKTDAKKAAQQSTDNTWKLPDTDKVK
jgi:hypothetical protein